MNRTRWQIALVSSIVLGAVVVARLRPGASQGAESVVTEQAPVRSERLDHVAPGQRDGLARPGALRDASPTDVRRVSSALAESKAAPATATLQIVAVDQHGRPIEGVEIDVELHTTDPNPEARYLKPRYTDALGRAHLSVPSGTVISVGPWPTAAVFFEEVEPSEVGPFLAGSTNQIELRIELPTGWFHVLVLDDHDQPLPDVELHARGFVDARPTDRLWDVAPASTTTDAGGRASFALETWWGGSVLATKPGYSPHHFAIDADHGDPSDPFVARVLPAGAMEVTVIGERLVGQRLRVVLETSWGDFSSGDFESYFQSDPTWSVHLNDASRVARFERLPADASYSAALYDGAQLIAAHPDRFRLRPLETRQLEFELGVGATVVGCATRSETTRLTPAVSVGFEIDAETRSLTVPFVAPERYSIRGKVLSPEGVAAPEWPTVCWVHASREGRQLGLQCRPDEDGTFVLEPLIEGSYEISASTHYGLQLGDVTVPGIRAGTTDLELRLPRVCELALRIVDAASGKSRQGKVTVRDIDGEHVMGADIYEEEAPNQSERENILELRPGAYSIFARADDGAMAIVRSIEVRAEATVQSLDIEVPLPALVYLTRSAGAGGALPVVYYEVTCDGLVVADDSFSTPRSGPIPIPCMPSSMRLSLDPPEPEAEHTPPYGETSRDLMLAPGTTLELAFERDFEWLMWE